MARIWTVFHALHEVMIFYFSISLVLEIMYFEPTSFLRVFSLVVAVVANLYLLVYTLYIYYSFMSYPGYELGSKELRKVVVVFGSFVRNIRHEDYDVLLVLYRNSRHGRLAISSGLTTTTCCPTTKSS